METSVINKIGILFKYCFSSFLNIELFIITVLSFVLLYLVLYRNGKVLKVLSSILLILFLSIIIICFCDYAANSVDYFIKALMKYYYFPSMGIYFMIVVFVSILLLISLLSGLFSKFVKMSICILSFLVYLLFIQFLAYIISNNIMLTLDVSIYSNIIILSIVQLSNMLVFIWLVIIFFYKLYLFFRKKFD